MAPLGLGIALATASLPASAFDGVPTSVVSTSAPPTTVTGKPRGFTPAKGDPRLAASVAKRSSGERLSFTATGVEKAQKNDVRVAAHSNITPARTSTDRRVADVVDSSRRTSVVQSDYNLGVDVGWKRLGVSGEVRKREGIGGSAPLVEREGGSVGMSYDLGRVRPQVSVSADRETSRISPALEEKENVSLDVGTALKVGRNVAITGGVRYRVDRERLAEPGAEASRIDSQAVYVGTKLKF
ncbi:hypothetical protein WJS89_07720 [Sphingomicrobium sp. XHP0235]|uniref:hypothetical protein n=1 Tax=Sphingomicrobium aquimarinum TaxID=3133971 RepID=UPI0031FE8512